jgi:RimJ/RimL family protein N-acetyltransferase
LLGDEALTVIEPLTPDHFAKVAEWLSNAELNQWLTSEWRNRSIDPVVIGVAVRNKRNRLFLVRFDDRPCGLVALADWDPTDKIAMTWYVLGDSTLGGRGVITAALKELVRTAFEELGIDVVYAWIIEDNHRSRRVLEKVGFRKMGNLRAGSIRNGRRVDRIYFDLTKEDRAWKST